MATHIERGLIARERDTPEVRKARHDRGRRQKVMREQPHRLIFPDETGTNTKMTREYGRSLRGERLRGSAPFRRWGNRTLIAGLSCDGIVAPWVISGAMDRDAFDTCIEKVLIAELEPGSVIILDNLATHRSDTAARMLKGPWLPAFVPARLQPRFEPHRDGLPEAEGPSAQDWGPNPRSTHRGHRRHLRPLHPRPMPELLSSRRICLMNKWKRFSG